MPPNNKKQRGRAEKKKRNEAQQAAQQKAEAEQAQQKAAEVQAQQKLALKRAEMENTFRRTQLEAELRRQFGTPAIDTLIQDMAAAAAAANSSSTSTTEQEEGVVVCYHGSSIEQFDAGTSVFLTIVQSYVALQKKYHHVGVVTDQHRDANIKFFCHTENRQIMNSVECTNFVFALGVSLYLKLTSAEKESYRKLQASTGSTLVEKKKTASYEVEMILQLGLIIKYSLIPRMIGEKDDNLFYKYYRDSETERGVINCLYRETSCDCMVADKDRANNMDKMDLCHKCAKEFPKATTKLCDGCERVVYCSVECQSKDWPRHEDYCKKVQKNKPKYNDKTKKKKKTAATTGTTATSTTTESMSTPGAAGARTNKSQSSPTTIEVPPTTEVVPTTPVASVVSQLARRITVPIAVLNPTRATPAGAKSRLAADVIAPTSDTQKPATTPKSISKPVLGPLGGNKPVATTASLPPSPIVMKVDRGDEGVKPNMDMAVDDCDSNETTK